MRQITIIITGASPRDEQHLENDLCEWVRYKDAHAACTTIKVEDRHERPLPGQAPTRHVVMVHDPSPRRATRYLCTTCGDLSLLYHDGTCPRCKTRVCFDCGEEAPARATTCPHCGEALEHPEDIMDDGTTRGLDDRHDCPTCGLHRPLNHVHGV